MIGAMNQASVITRFAPSPTGYLHLGHAFSALFAEHQARAAGGRFLLRLEDIDPTRCRPQFAEAILDDLAWLGLHWDGPVRTQSQHLDDYRTALTHLQDRGLLYPCFCTRKEIEAEIARSSHAPHGPDGVLYPGTCRALDPSERRERLDSGQPYALRLDMLAAIAQAGSLTWRDLEAGTKTARPEIFGDVVLARKDTPTSYHLAVVWDDALQGISLVTRGHDLFEASHVHRLLQALLALPVPDYRHHRLLTDAEGRRYAKRDKALTIASLRQNGKTPTDIRRMTGFIPSSK